MIADDAILMPPDGPVVSGRDAIVAEIAKENDTKTAQQTATVDEVIVTGDHAYARGTWNVTPIAGAGASTQPQEGKWSILYKRGADGTWLTSRWMWNQEAAPRPSGS
jgi:ketosteroid isomerase-like protein